MAYDPPSETVDTPKLPVLLPFLTAACSSDVLRLTTHYSPLTPHHSLLTPQRRGGHDLHDLAADAELVRGEGALQIGQRPGAERADGLFHQVLEQLLDEGAAGLLAAGQVEGEVAGA